MRTNGAVTLYNKYIDSDGLEQYVRAVVKDVFWQDRKAANVRSMGGYAEADTATIYIPQMRSGHVDPIEWQALSDKTAKWTIQTADLIVRGAVTDEIIYADPLAAPPVVAFTVTDLKNKYDDVLVITIIDGSHIGSFGMQFWQVQAQ